MTEDYTEDAAEDLETTDVATDEAPVEVTAENPLEAMAQAFSSPSKSRGGTFESQLSPEEIAELDGFVAWLKTEDPNGTKSDNTANSYRSYVAQALAHFKAGGARKDLSTDVRSGINSFSRYLASKA